MDRAAVHYIRGESEEARGLRTQVLDIDARHTSAAFNLGVFYKNQGQVQKATELSHK